ncbi:MAG TPA: hypothetical protein VLA49_03265 [Anaerolineales bacterium]|nr:hypothetical protein [Anaerolineales bacterium]
MAISVELSNREAQQAGNLPAGDELRQHRVVVIPAFNEERFIGSIFSTVLDNYRLEERS